MQLDWKPTKILITGRSGTGKTTYFVRYLVNTKARVRFVFDHQGEFARRLNLKAATQPWELATQINSGWVVFDPARMFPGRIQDAFNYFCEWAFTCAQVLDGRKLFACDELQVLVGTNQVSTELALVLETGRRYGLDCVLISQQPNLIHNRIRNQLTEVVTFQQMDASAIAFLEDAGFDEARIRSLQPGQYIARNLNTGGETSGKVF